LLKYQNLPAIKDVAGLWKAKPGDARVEIYAPSEGAAWYIAKMFPYEGMNYDMGGMEYFARLPGAPRQLVQ